MRRIAIVLVLLGLVSCTRAAEDLDLARLKLPPDFHIGIFAQAPHARFMTFTPAGVLLVTDTTDGTVLAFSDPQHTGHAARTVTVLDDLNAPHGIALYQGKLYVAETNRVRSYDWNEAELKATNPHMLTALPGSGMHFTRTVLIHDNRMLVSVGSDCNVCVESDPLRATVLSFNLDGGGQSIYGKGLRNAVGLAVNPRTKTVWATVNGRDWLGDDLPPDMVVDLGKGGGHFGWPYCYGKGIVDPANKAEGEKICPTTTPPVVEIPAHSAPLGLGFYDGSMFPAQYRGNLFIALHGSWNRSVLHGYKVVMVKLGPDGKPQGGLEDFITGWIKPGELKNGPRMGRPAGIAVGPDGAMYVSDDTAGVVYRVTYGKN